MSEQEQEERPDWMVEKFTTVEDQARAYAEAEREMGRMREEMARDRDNFQIALQNMEALRPEDQQTPPPQQYNPDQDPLLQQYQQALDMGDARALLAINLELNRQQIVAGVQEGLKELSGTVQRNQDVDREMAITMATERVARQYPDWEEIAPEVGRLLQQNSEWIPTSSSVEAYEKAIGQAARVIRAERILVDNDRTERTRQEKIASQGLTGDSARVFTPEESQAAWERVKNAKLTGYSGILGSG